MALIEYKCFQHYSLSWLAVFKAVIIAIILRYEHLNNDKLIQIVTVTLILRHR
jgi:hypothetical protein